VDHDYLNALGRLAGEHGVAHTGVAPATVLHRARAALVHRKRRGLHDQMEFTYRNPQRSTDPQAAVRGAQAVFVGARSYAMPEPPSAPLHGRVARYAWVDHYEPLRDALWAVAGKLRADGYRAVVFADDNSLVDREVAYLAGLGWFGKNANLLLPGRGSYFVLGSVVTTAPLPVSVTPVADGCGACRRCIDACPTGAIVADGVIDAARCLAWVLQKPGSIPVSLRTAIGDRVYGCDDCQTSCPPTIRWSGREHARAGDAEIRAWVPLLGLLDADDHAVLQRWGRWYVADRDPRWIRRNALVALGNTAQWSDPQVRAVIQRYCSSDDTVLAEHATWARARLTGSLSADPA
jgi:epoxyqueuosine reductase